jgi:hypothetical protein
MNLKTITMVFGAILLIVGILGFIPGITVDDHLMGIFEVDLLHNLVHILTGGAAIAAAMSNAKNMKLFYQAFAVVYGLVTVLGFLTGQGLGVLIPVNMADNLLHVAITAFAAYFGFVYKDHGAKAA